MNRTITTTVFTDAEGPYRLWAHAVGFEASRAAVTLRAAERARHAFAVRAIADVAPQRIDQTTVRSKGRVFVRDKIATGSAEMPGQQRSLSPRQIDQVVAYLETRTPAERPTGEPGWW